MTNQEFSNEFDILYNNIASNQAPGLDEYEKSVFLTKAQDAIVLELYNGKNIFGDSFEKTEEVRQYLSGIITTKNLEESEDQTQGKIVSKSFLYKKPDDLWFPVYEEVKFIEDELQCVPTSNVEVVPVTHDEFSRINKNPFRNSNLTRVLRLDYGNNIELVSNYNIESYTLRYIKSLDPIILENLDASLTIKGESEALECKLNPVLHPLILDRAVEMAKITMGLVESGR